jgi:hypothetical protein
VTGESLAHWRPGVREPVEARSRAEGAILAYVEGGEPSSRGRDNGSLARLFWRALDAFDYWLTQAKLWTVDAAWGPEPETAADRQRERSPGS